MIPFIQSVTLADNFEINPTTFVGLRTAKNLQSVIFTNLQAVNGFRFSDFYFDQCKELSSIVLSGTIGIGVIPTTVQFPKPTILESIPQNWSNLSRVSIVNFGNCGFTPLEVDEIIKGFAIVITNGFGSSVITAKSITINGINGKLTITDAKVAEAKATILAKGWTILTN